MNDGKALGRDGINAEPLKCGGYRLNELLHKVLDWRCSSRLEECTSHSFVQEGFYKPI